MGRGDKRSRKGKIFKGSYGNSRPHKVKTAAAPAAAPKKAKAEKPAKKAAVKKAPAKKAAAKKKTEE
jgi:30S ribosomal protein S31